VCRNDTAIRQFNIGQETLVAPYQTSFG